MLKGKTVLAVVPARGGSKGVKLKNIHPLHNKPLLVYTADVIRETNFFDSAIVSTDHDGIASVARDSGLEVPFYRPEALSGDRIGDYQVLIHALTEMERLKQTTYDIIVMLQPTCPLRTASHVTTTVTKLIEGDWDAVWTVSTTNLKYHPLKQLTLTPAGKMDYYDFKGTTIIARQQLSQVYHRNGAAYAFSRSCLLNEKTIKPQRTAAVVIDEPLISIDTLDDFIVIEHLMQREARS